MDKRLKIALAGNPNSGKSTIFNDITGARQHVANYPGVTVEIKLGTAFRDGTRLELVDLPGTYSLTAYSPEELVARDYILQQKPDVVVAVVDASNLERNLYLVVQLLELGTPVVVALNMMDVAERLGLTIDLELLSRLVGVPFVATVGHRGKGIEELTRKVMEVAGTPAEGEEVLVRYGRDVGAEIEKISALLSGEGALLSQYPARWLALSLLEEDGEVVSLVAKEGANAEEILSTARAGAARIRSLTGTSVESFLADRRYGFISGAFQEAVKSSAESRHVFSDKIDVVATHSVLGMVILLLLMYVVFYFTFNIAAYPSRWIETARLYLGGLVDAAWPRDPLQPLSLQSLLVDGILAGVGSVVQFLPNVMVLFLAIAALEDSGYMARAAFVMDRLMHKMGLHGKSFIPMVLGFGCTVPAIMATRIVENRRDRLTTMFIVPLMSCSGKYPTYTLIVAAFFPLAWRGPILWLVYLFGVAVAVAVARLLKSTLLAGESLPFVMELPPYRMPTARGLLVHMWERSWAFVKKAGTVILVASVILWFFGNWPHASRETLAAAGGETAARRMVLEKSLVGRTGKAMEPALEAVGLDWKVGTALIGAVAAKEIFVAQMGIIYGLADETGAPHDLSEHLQADYPPLAGLTILLFTLIASPCIATVAVMRRESRSWGWPVLQWAGLTGLAYVLSLAVYQAGRLLGWGVG